MTILEDGSTLPDASDDDSGFIRPDDGPGSQLECGCGSRQFEVYFPEFVVTIVKCVQCGKKAVVHDG